MGWLSSVDWAELSQRGSGDLRCSSGYLSARADYYYREKKHAFLCNSRFITESFPFFCQTGFDPAATWLKGCSAAFGH